MRARQVTVVDIAAYLGLTPGRVRQIVAKHGIKPTGQWWKAKLYDPHEIAEHAGWEHRPQSAARARRRANIHSDAVPRTQNE